MNEFCEKKYMHQISDPSILYFGTPVVLISTVNDDSSINLAPISSIFWLGWRCMIGISALSKTTENLLRTKEAVLSLPSVFQADGVNKLARTTGSNPVPEGKKQKGYNYVQDKFGIAGFTQQPSQLVYPPRVKECPVQMEVSLASVHPLGSDNKGISGKLMSLELRVLRVHLNSEILLEGHLNRVDPDKWRPLIMSFQHFYGLGSRVGISTLAQIPEDLYRSPETPTLVE